MKRLKFLFGVSAIATAFGASAQVTAKQSTASFGRFGNDCSSGRGVCAFNAQQTAATATTSKSAEKTSANTFVFRAKRSDLSTQDEIRIVGKAIAELTANERPMFQQVDAITLDAATVSNLGFASAYNKIPAGSYPMNIYSDHVEVTFTVSP